jgi:CubicO group peptidase (beta-lactamase class C family)
MTSLTSSRLSRRTLLRATAATSAATVASALFAAPISADIAPGSSVRRPLAADSTAVNFGHLADQVRAEMERLGVPGVAVGVVHGDHQYVAGFGVTNIDHPLPVDADTLFQIGSTTKTVTATAIMRLVEMGRLSLDAPVREYLPGFQLADEDVARRVTVRHLMTHTAGWFGDLFTDTGPGDDAVARYVEMMAMAPQIAPLDYAFSYNNAAFVVAGRIIEVLTGDSYEEVIEEMILEPLGMNRSVQSAAEAIRYRVAVGHNPTPEGLVVAQPWALPRSVNPAGGLISSVRDQVRYARFHLGDGTVNGARLLSPESLVTMRSLMGPGATLGFDELDGVGVSWLLRSIGNTRIAQHGGSTIGQQSAFLLVPERGFAITILTNADQGAELNQRVITWALGHYLGLVEAPPTPLELPPEALQPYVGRYEFAPGSPVAGEVTVEDGRLVLRVDAVAEPDVPMPEIPPLRMALYAPDRVVALDPPVAGLRSDFVRRPDGRVGWYRFSGRLLLRVEPGAPPAVGMPAPMAAATPIRWQEPISGAISGDTGGSYAHYHFEYPGDGSRVRVTLVPSEHIATTMNALGFVVYGPTGGRVYARGEVSNDGRMLVGEFTSAEAGHYLIQVYSYLPNAPVSYVLTLAAV